MDKTIYNDPTIKEFLQIRELESSTVRNYIYILQIYSNFINLSPTEFIEQAEKEEKNLVMLRKRKINQYLLTFKEYLQTEKNYSPQNIGKFMTIVRSFYKQFSIELPYLNVKKKSTPRISINDIPTKDHVREILSICNRKYKAIITLMFSSGLGASEILSLTYQDFLNSISKYVETPINAPVDVGVLKSKLIENDELIIATWYVTRKKTKYNYTTFSSPESINYILDYLSQSPPIDPESSLFRTARNQDISLQYNAFKNYFSRLNDELKYGTVGRQRFFHSHVLRAIFASTLYKNKLPELVVHWLLGHRINPVTEAYFKADINSLREQYITCIPELSIEDTEIRVLDSEDKKRLDELEVKYDKLLKIMDDKDEFKDLP
jgi:integrase